MFIKLEDIIVKERIREDIGEEEITELMSSLKAFRQLQPIVVTQSEGNTFELIAGERRLIATKRLAAKGESARGIEVGYIWAEPIDSPSAHVRLQIEFDENMKRKDFTFIEKARFIRKFHESMEAAATAAGGTWTNSMTAVSLRLSDASISHYLRVEEAIKNDPQIAAASTLDAAVKRMKVAEKLEVRKQFAQQETPDTLKKAESILRLGDALELIKSVPSESVTLVNFDPPWGDDVGYKSNDGAWDGNFDDSTETSDKIINALLPELYRVMRPDSIMIYWYRQWAYQDMCTRLEAAGFNLKFTRTPCIWFKPDKVSDQQRVPEKALINGYETFLLARKGDPVFNERGYSNVFAFSRVPRALLIHPTEKPIELCATLIRVCTVPGEVVLDPTAGSAAFLHAALSANRKPLGFELSEDNYGRALTRLAEYLKTRNDGEIK